MTAAHIIVYALILLAIGIVLRRPTVFFKKNPKMKFPPSLKRASVCFNCGKPLDELYAEKMWVMTGKPEWVSELVDDVAKAQRFNGLHEAWEKTVGPVKDILQLQTFGQITPLGDNITEKLQALLPEPKE